jgi:hypothetical protein
MGRRDLKQSIEQSILSSIINAWRYSDEHYLKLISITLNENIFSGYNKAIARAINKLNEDDKPINDLEICEFLDKAKYLKDDIYFVLEKQSLPYSVVLYYLEYLEYNYKLNLIGV